MNKYDTRVVIRQVCLGYRTSTLLEIVGELLDRGIETSSVARTDTYTNGATVTAWTVKLENGWTFKIVK